MAEEEEALGVVAIVEDSELQTLVTAGEFFLASMSFSAQLGVGSLCGRGVDAP